MHPRGSDSSSSDHRARKTSSPLSRLSEQHLPATIRLEQQLTTLRADNWPCPCRLRLRLPRLQGFHCEPHGKVGTSIPSIEFTLATDRGIRCTNPLDPAL